MVKVEFIFTSLESDKSARGGKHGGCGRGEINRTGYPD